MRSIRGKKMFSIAIGYMYYQYLLLCLIAFIGAGLSIKFRILSKKENLILISVAVVFSIFLEINLFIDRKNFCVVEEEGTYCLEESGQFDARLLTYDETFLLEDGTKKTFFASPYVGRKFFDQGELEDGALYEIKYDKETMNLVSVEKLKRAENIR